MSYIPQPVAPARRKVILRAVTDGRRLGIATAHLDNAAAPLRQHLNAHWFGPRRMWAMRAGLCGTDVTRRLVDAFPAHYLDLDEVPDLIERAIATPQSDYFTQLLDLQIIPLESGAHAVAGAYDLYFVEAMRYLKGRYHKFAAAWEVKAAPDAILEALAKIAGVDPVFVFIHETSMRLEDLASKPSSPIPISVPGKSPLDGVGLGANDEEGTGFLSGCAQPLEHLYVDETALAQASIDCSLMEHQPAAVRHLLARSAALLADDMGLGKTRAAVVACKLAAGDARILISCPASLRINWEREIHAVYPNDLVGMVGEDRMSTLRGCQWVIANYERLGGLVREADLQFAVLAFDEAHLLKEYQAGRTRNAFLLAERIPRRFLLTGTPILNREIELHTLLRLSGHPIGNLELSKFRAQYSGGQEQRHALADAVSDWMLRRSKKVLKNLGLKTRQVRYIEPTEGLDAYKELMADMTLTVMPKIVKLRQMLESLKVDFVLETVQSLRPEDKVIVFCEYMDTVAFLKEALQNIGIAAVSLVGADNSKVRQRAVDAFQADPDVRMFIGTTSAAGVGITLTAANYVVFCSQPWTPALMRQAEDRAYRNGQTRDVIVIVPVIADTIDEQILALLESKADIEADVVESAVRAQLARKPVPDGPAVKTATTISQLSDCSIH